MRFTYIPLFQFPFVYQFSIPILSPFFKYCHFLLFHFHFVPPFSISFISSISVSIYFPLFEFHLFPPLRVLFISPSSSSIHSPSSSSIYFPLFANTVFCLVDAQFQLLSDVRALRFRKKSNFLPHLCWTKTLLLRILKRRIGQPKNGRIRISLNIAKPLRLRPSLELS